MTAGAYTIRHPSPGGVPSRYLPPRSFEYLFYVQVFYSIMGPIVGISISMLGLTMLLGIGALCMIRMGEHFLELVRPVSLALASGVSFIAVQTVVHGQSLTGDYVREFVPWMIGTVVIQYLAMRQGFLNRFSLLVFLIGVSTLPFARSFANDQSRVGLDKAITIANPNDLGAWFGFCCVYFAVLGFETRRLWVGAAAWSAAVASLLVVGLTVSRTPLFAAAVSILFAFRRVLKRGFLPVISVAVIAWFAYGLGLFDRAAGLYAQRGMEETGRFLIWPLAIRRFLDVPFTGVGINHVATYLPRSGFAVTPHNGLIFLALSSGIVPVGFFIAYWIGLYSKVFKASAAGQQDAALYLPLLIYSTFIMLSLNQAFMVSWMMGTLGSITATAFVTRATRGFRRRQHVTLPTSMPTISRAIPR
jgi:hypothetical protein